MKHQIYISHNWKTIKSFISQKKNKSSSLIKQLSEEFKKELNIPLNIPIIMTGHQPIIYYPGIFTKLIVANKIAELVKGKAYYIVLDTDTQLIDWKFIFVENNNYFQKKQILNSPKEILLKQKLSHSKKQQLIKTLKEWKLYLYHLFEPDMVPQIQNTIEEIIHILNHRDFLISELSVEINKLLMQKLKIHIEPIYVSELAKTESFKKILNIIINKYDLFYKIYNKKLIQFREINKIKNPAIPFPNLNKNELPFWKSNGIIREPLFINDDLNKISYIFPKAISLSICIRIFLSDLMIHGTGGGFYDLVTEEIIKEFFEEDPSPYMVATSTLYLKAKASIPLKYDTPSQLIEKLRKWRFNPELYLNDNCYLKKQKVFLIHLKNYYDSLYSKFKKKYFYKKEIINDINLKKQYQDLFIKIQKEPEKYGYFIHKEFLKINHKMHLYTSSIKKKLQKKMQKSLIVKNNQNIFLDRTYPVFYYDIFDFKKSVEELFLHEDLF